VLATFVIGLREGLEAALIVGIIAAFLAQDGNSRALRLMWTGIALAVLLCLGVGIALAVLSGSLPQRRQEMLETVIGLVAVAMVTWMVLWMRQHSKDLRKELGRAAGGALEQGTSFALVAMAFLAVVREGVETAVFLVAASQTSAGGATFVGAALGVAVASVLGYLIYRGGVKVNLSRFFRITGVVLVLVAGGVLMSSLHHAYEADWITVGNQVWLDFSAVLAPGSVPESLLTGVFGIRAQLHAIEVLAWAVYVVPMLAVVLWPPRRSLAKAVLARLLLGVGAAALAAAVLLATLVSRPAVLAEPVSFSMATSGDPSGRITLTPQTITADRIVIRLSGSVTTAELQSPINSVLTLPLVGAADVGGRQAATFGGPPLPPVPGGAPSTMTARELADLNGGRYPVGLRAADGDAVLTVTGTVRLVPTIALDRASGSPLTVSVRATPVLVAAQEGGRTHRLTLDGPVFSADPASTASATTAAAQRSAALGRAVTLGELVPWVVGVWGAVVTTGGLLLFIRRTRPTGSAGGGCSATRSPMPAAEAVAAQRVSATPSGA